MISNIITNHGVLTRITIISKVSGIHTTLIDTEDLDKVKDSNWCYVEGHSPRARKNSKIIILSREILGIKDSNILVDHRNLDTLDNRKCNLRIANKSKNAINCGLRKDNCSGFRGVWYDKNRKCFESYITFNQKKVHIGRFNNINEAKNARIKKEIELFGDFSCVLSH